MLSARQGGFLTAFHPIFGKKGRAHTLWRLHKQERLANPHRLGEMFGREQNSTRTLKTVEVVRLLLLDSALTAALTCPLTAALTHLLTPLLTAARFAQPVATIRLVPSPVIC